MVVHDFVSIAYLLDVLALEFREEGVEAVLIGVDTDRLKDALDISGRGAGVATKAEQEVGCEVLHFDFWPATVSCIPVYQHNIM
jgi:hypothetical protein